MLKDTDIREPLFNFLEEKYGKIRIFEEKNIGRSRADVIMITDGFLYGIEIKSDADTYQRLDRQIKDYDLFGDFNYVVVGSTHASHVGEHVPDYWGIISVENTEYGIDFYILREPKQNEHMSLRCQMTFLWRFELAHIQELNQMYKYAGKSKLFVIDKIMETVETERLKRQMTDELFERDYTTVAEKINEYRRAHNQKPRRKKKYKKRKIIG